MLNFISTLPGSGVGRRAVTTQRNTTATCHNGINKLHNNNNNNNSRHEGSSTLFVRRCNLNHYSSSFTTKTSRQRLTTTTTTPLDTPCDYSYPNPTITQSPPHRQVIHCRRGGSSSRNKSSFASSAAPATRYGGDGRRRNRVGELIRREIGVVIDGFCGGMMKGAMVSVVNVKCSDDLRNARVHISVFGGDEDEAVGLLRKNAKEIRYRLAQCIDLKYMPMISFQKSEMTAATKTVNIINQLKRDREEEGKEEDVGKGDKGDDDLDYDVNAKDALL